MPRKIAAALGGVAGVLLVAIGLVALIVAALRGDPVRALSAIWAGSIGEPASLVNSLINAVPLTFTGLSIAVAFRCGVWNIGAEGQLLVGMLGAAVTALSLPALHPLLGVPLCLAGGALAGALWATLPGLLKLKREVPEVISTIMLNFLAVYLLEYLVRGPLRDPTNIDDISRALPEWSRLGRLSAWGFALPSGDIHAGVGIALAVVFVLWFWLARSGVGFRIRAVGLNAGAAGAAGLPVGRTVMTAFLLSGALAGLGGAVEQLAVISRLHRYAPGVPGYGFSGIAVALLGRLHPLGAVAGAFLFGALSAGCDKMQRDAHVSVHVVYVIQAVVILLLVAVPRLPRRYQRRPPTPETAE